MAYLKPNAFTRKVFNPVAMRLGMSGSQTLVVPRRRSGAPQRIPVIPVEHGGARYIVSTRGESDWVRNLREAGGGEIESKAGLEAFRAAEIPLEQRDPIIAAYREKAGKTVETYWKQLPDPKDHPVFRVEPAGG
jgi:deazaflavin-dependent oxidoreductase (nitroreductase family)